MKKRCLSLAGYHGIISYIFISFVPQKLSLIIFTNTFTTYLDTAVIVVYGALKANLVTLNPTNIPQSFHQMCAIYKSAYEL
ncbi:CLUMA_CG005041, isoform A [Clunio marinus]|uniref:CLUMA_CG005041, isoform A n=1 Tax=Clunio marinus TaxID=568069 RepID=A0A1J1HTH0_9DIPT|nr:CLUMA_CG005041, isoform A [Clunio marinus]